MKFVLPECNRALVSAPVIIFALLTGLSLLVLGFTTGVPNQPPTQALTFGGMYFIAAAYGKMWRTHGIGAATVISLMAIFSLGPAVWEAVKSFIAAETISTPLIGQSIGFVITATYFVVGLRYLLKMLRASKRSAS